MELDSPRLRLRLLCRAELQALLDGAHGVGGLTWAPGYPTEGTLVAAALHVELHGAGTPPGRFGHYQVIRREDGLVLGDIGFHAPPDELGEVSVGFGIVAAARRRGYASEALRTLLSWALVQPEVRAVNADTERDNVASQRVLGRAGMRLVGEVGDRRIFEIAAPWSAP